MDRTIISIAGTAPVSTSATRAAGLLSRAVMALLGPAHLQPAAPS